MDKEELKIIKARAKGVIEKARSKKVVSTLQGAVRRKQVQDVDIKMNETENKSASVLQGFLKRKKTQDDLVNVSKKVNTKINKIKKIDGVEKMTKPILIKAIQEHFSPEKQKLSGLKKGDLLAIIEKEKISFNTDVVQEDIEEYSKGLFVSKLKNKTKSKK